MLCASTACDIEGEQNWAELLREWLPSTYHVVTKGRIINEKGLMSPQVDVVVLKPPYPPKLLEKKVYLAAGVAAAFECKTTLKSSHIAEAVDKCMKIKSLYRERTGSPYKELQSPIVYGLLAHSHSFTSDLSIVLNKIQQKLNESDRSEVTHSRLQLDILCVADLATWILVKSIPMNKFEIQTIYWANAEGESQPEQFTPIGSLVLHLSRKLAWEDCSLRDLTEYYRNTRIGGKGPGSGRIWPLSIFSNEVARQIQVGVRSLTPWDEWFPTS